TYKKGAETRETDIQPMYSLKGTLTNYRLQQMTKQALKQYGHLIEEFLPPHVLKAYKLPERREAWNTLHRPKSRETLKHARRRMIYEELLLFQLKMQLIREQTRQSSTGNAQLYDEEKVSTFLKSLPFKLTESQMQVLQEI